MISPLPFFRGPNSLGTPCPLYQGKLALFTLHSQTGESIYTETHYTNLTSCEGLPSSKKVVLNFPPFVSHPFSSSQFSSSWEKEVFSRLTSSGKRDENAPSYDYLSGIIAPSFAIQDRKVEQLMLSLYFDGPIKKIEEIALIYLAQFCQMRFPNLNHSESELHIYLGSSHHRADHLFYEDLDANPQILLTPTLSAN